MAWGTEGGDGFSTVKAQQGDDNRETTGYVERGLSGGPALVVRRVVVKLERLVLMCASYLLLPCTGTTISHQSNFHCSWTPFVPHYVQERSLCISDAGHVEVPLPTRPAPVRHVAPVRSFPHPPLHFPSPPEQLHFQAPPRALPV